MRSMTKSGHKGTGHSRHGCRETGRLSSQGSCYFGLLVKFAEPIRPRPILFQVPLHIRHQIAHPFAPVIARHFVMQIAEAAFNRISARTIGGQKQQLKAGMLSEPALDERSLMNLVVIRHHLDSVPAPRRVGALQNI